MRSFIVTTVEPRRLNTSLLRLLKSSDRWGEPKSLGLNWNRRDTYIRNGTHCNYTGSLDRTPSLGSLPI